MVSNYNGQQDYQDNPEEEIAREAANPLDEPLLSTDWVKSRMEEGRTKFQSFYDNCNESEDFYLNRYDFNIPETGTMLRLGTAQSVVNSLVAHVTPQFIDISVPPPGPRGQARAENIEKFLRGAKHMALYGIAFEKTEFAANRWQEFPEPPEDEQGMEEYKKKLNEILENRNISFPIQSNAINPKMMVWDTNNGPNPRWLIHFYDIDAEWVNAHFPNWKGKLSGDIQFVEVWTHTQVAYMADGKWALKPKKHGYGTLPFTIYHPNTGLMTEGNKPEHLYRGILHGNFDMMRAESRLASQYLDIVAQSAWQTKDFTGPPGITEQVMEMYEETPGAKNFVPQNVSINPSKVVEPPASIQMAQQMMSQSIEANTAPAVVRGERPQGAASGYHTAVLAGIASLNFGPYVEASQRGLQNRNSIVLSIVENVIRDKVTVFGKTEAGSLDAIIRPNDIKGHTINMVQLTPTSPEEQERKLNLWNQLWLSGFTDHDTALRKAGVSNAFEVKSKILAEQFINSEAVQAALQQAAAERVPLLQQIVEAAGGGTNQRQASDIAQSIMNQQPNAGQFSGTNQPPSTLASERQRVDTNTRPVIPGSMREQELVGREISSPARTGNRRVPTSDLPPGSRY